MLMLVCSLPPWHENRQRLACSDQDVSSSETIFLIRLTDEHIAESLKGNRKQWHTLYFQQSVVQDGRNQGWTPCFSYKLSMTVVFIFLARLFWWPTTYMEMVLFSSWCCLETMKPQETWGLVHKEISCSIYKLSVDKIRAIRAWLVL